MVVDLETEHSILAIVAMSLSVSPQGPVRIMVNGLEMHQPVKVRQHNAVHGVRLCDHKFSP